MSRCARRGSTLEESEPQWLEHKWLRRKKTSNDIRMGKAGGGSTGPPLLFDCSTSVQLLPP
eukprot:6081665-Pyramimonas_sp.AAC.1